MVPTTTPRRWPVSANLHLRTGRRGGREFTNPDRFLQQAKKIDMRGVHLRLEAERARRSKQLYGGVVVERWIWCVYWDGFCYPVRIPDLEKSSKMVVKYSQEWPVLQKPARDCKIAGRPRAVVYFLLENNNWWRNFNFVKNLRRFEIDFKYK